MEEGGEKIGGGRVEDEGGVVDAHLVEEELVKGGVTRGRDKGGVGRRGQTFLSLHRCCRGRNTRFGGCRTPQHSWLYVPFLLDAFGRDRYVLFQKPAWWDAAVAAFTVVLTDAGQQPEGNVHDMRTYGQRATGGMGYGSNYVFASIQNQLLEGQPIGQSLGEMVTHWRNAIEAAKQEHQLARVTAAQVGPAVVPNFMA